MGPLSNYFSLYHPSSVRGDDRDAVVVIVVIIIVVGYAKSSYRNGILEIVFPRKQGSGSTKISIE
ncbi:MAG: hypothetical protein AB1753_01900 [Thermoproteota archaeon]